MRSPTAFLVLCVLLSAATSRASEPLRIDLEIGPVGHAAAATRSIVFDRDTLRQTHRFDLQDGRDHNMRGVSLRELVALAKAPKAIDAAIFVYADGMQIPVHLGDKSEVDAIFIALQHGDARDRFDTSYPLLNKTELACPKVVYGNKVTTYSIWLYPAQLASIKLVAWKVQEATLAQPTRRLPDRSGWPIYLHHCQPCHGIGGQGATRGPDFLSNMEAYRRVPPLAVTDISEHPSLHEKVKGFTDGTMPVLNQVSNAEIATLWRWLHAIHRSATN
jgi:hypothetical protein